MGIFPYKALCNAALCVFHISLLKVALSKVFDPDIKMKGKSGADCTHIVCLLSIYCTPIVCLLYTYCFSIVFILPAYCIPKVCLLLRGPNCP